jgi:hypothetical protein
MIQQTGGVAMGGQQQNAVKLTDDAKKHEGTNRRRSDKSVPVKKSGPTKSCSKVDPFTTKISEKKSRDSKSPPNYKGKAVKKVVMNDDGTSLERTGTVDSFSGIRKVYKVRFDAHGDEPACTENLKQNEVEELLVDGKRKYAASYGDEENDLDEGKKVAAKKPHQVRLYCIELIDCCIGITRHVLYLTHLTLFSDGVKQRREV